MNARDLMTDLLIGKKIQAGASETDYYFYLDKNGDLRNGQDILVEILNLNDAEMLFREYNEKD